MTHRQHLLAMTAAAGLLALPVMALQSATAGAEPAAQPRSGATVQERQAQATPPRDASGGVLAQQRDGTPGNPPAPPPSAPWMR